MFNGFYRLVTWSTLLSLIVMLAMMIADTQPGIDAFIEHGLGGLWLGTSAAIFAGSLIIYITSIIGHKMQNQPPDYDLGPYIRRSLVIGMFFVMAIHTAAQNPVTIPLNNIFAFTLGMFLGLTLVHMILIGGLMWAAGMIEIIVHLIVDRISHIPPKRKTDEILQWEIPKQ